MTLSTTSLQLTTVYDNYAGTSGVQTRHGFACLIETRRLAVLFDTGGEGAVLMDNMKRLGIDPKRRVEAVVLSHVHGDHTGGLGAFLAADPNVEVFVPASFAGRFRNQIQAAGARLREVSGPIQLSAAVATTGEMGEQLIEQSLMIHTPEGLVVVTGCAHPGVVEIVAHAKDLTGEKIHLVLGGFHLAGAREATLRRILADLRRLGVEKVAPCHCSGDAIRQLAQEVFGTNFIANGVGTVVKVGVEDRAAE